MEVEQALFKLQNLFTLTGYNYLARIVDFMFTIPIEETKAIEEFCSSFCSLDSTHTYKKLASLILGSFTMAKYEPHTLEGRVYDNFWYDIYDSLDKQDNSELNKILSNAKLRKFNAYSSLEEILNE